MKILGTKEMDDLKQAAARGDKLAKTSLRVLHLEEALQSISELPTKYHDFRDAQSTARTAIRRARRALNPRSIIFLADKKPALRLRPEWCKKPTAHDPLMRRVIFTDDGTCPCGIGKHHYHCGHCGGVTQVG